MTKRNSNIFTVLSIVLLKKIFLSQITTLDIKFPFPTPHYHVPNKSGKLSKSQYYLAVNNAKKQYFLSPVKFRFTYRVTKKTCQSVIFGRNTSAKFTKFFIYPTLRMTSPDLKSDFSYYYKKCAKIAIEILKK